MESANSPGRSRTRIWWWVSEWKVASPEKRLISRKRSTSSSSHSSTRPARVSAATQSTLRSAKKSMMASKVTAPPKWSTMVWCNSAQRGWNVGVERRASTLATAALSRRRSCKSASRSCPCSFLYSTFRPICSVAASSCFCRAISGTRYHWSTK
eukprot:2504306-Rhodomonas_salina.2